MAEVKIEIIADTARGVDRLKAVQSAWEMKKIGKK